MSESSAIRPTASPGPWTLRAPSVNISNCRLKEVQDHIKDLLDQKVVVEIHSTYAAPIVIVGKKNSSVYLCVDYRRLNEKTVRDAYHPGLSPLMLW